MSAPERRNGPSPPPPADAEPPADEEFARTYAAGYEEGVRSGLREVLQHTSRGHTAQELRILVESRLARLDEEVELKRRSLLGPPRRPAWNSLLRAPQPARPWAAPFGTESVAANRLRPGRSLLVREERPARGVELVRANVHEFPRAAIVSLHPPELPGLSKDRRTDIVPNGSGVPAGGPLSPGEVGGHLREPTEAPGGALVYVDALEYLTGEYGLELTLKFVNWLVGQVEQTGSALVVSFDRRSLDTRELSRLERAFRTVL
ncbi:MAG: hypothetical protein ACRECT_02950 [Thermoplasmata archaeon]